MIKVYGATFMRGVHKLDYPYIEMLTSISKLTEKIYVALGTSDDETEQNVKKLKNIEIIPTVWSDSLSGDGGKIFSEQANIAISKIREEISDNSAWILFLHCDEIIHPGQYEKLLNDIAYADQNGYDSVSLRFLHYWKDHYHIAVSKRWHPAEIRAFKLNADIHCYGDAQGFSGSMKRFESDVLIFHYGHVRPVEQHKMKQAEIMRRIRPKEKFDKYWKRELKAFAKTEMAKINIVHPSFMETRISRLNDPFVPQKQDEIFIVAKKIDAIKPFEHKVMAQKIVITDSISKVPWKKRWEKMVILEPSLIDSLLYNSPHDVKMKSKAARDWSIEMNLILRISLKGCFYQL